MLNKFFAPLKVRLASGELSSGSFVIFGVVLVNTGGGILTIDTVDANGTMLLPSFVMVPTQTLTIPVPVLADNGVKFTVSSGTPGDLGVTLFRSNTGA